MAYISWFSDFVVYLEDYLMVPGRFARESFRPESFRPWDVSPLFGGSFHPCFLLKHQGLSQAMFGDIYDNF